MRSSCVKCECFHSFGNKIRHHLRSTWKTDFLASIYFLLSSRSIYLHSFSSERRIKQKLEKTVVCVLLSLFLEKTFNVFACLQNIFNRTNIKLKIQTVCMHSVHSHGGILYMFREREKSKTKHAWKDFQLKCKQFVCYWNVFVVGELCICELRWIGIASNICCTRKYTKFSSSAYRKTIRNGSKIDDVGRQIRGTRAIMYTPCIFPDRLNKLAIAANQYGRRVEIQLKELISHCAACG